MLYAGRFPAVRRATTNSVEFHIPSKILTYADGSVLSYSLVWYAPEDRGVESRGTQSLSPGHPTPSGGSGPAEAGTPTFELRAENSDHGPEWVDCETADDLECWLADLREADRY